MENLTNLQRVDGSRDSASHTSSREPSDLLRSKKSPSIMKPYIIVMALMCNGYNELSSFQAIPETAT